MLSARGEIKHTAPGRAGKDNAVWCQILELVLEDFEAVSLKPSDLVLHAVDPRVVLRALQNSGVLFNRIDSLPFPCFCKRNRVSARTGKDVN
jgi:hypothetical protein